MRDEVLPALFYDITDARCEEIKLKDIPLKLSQSCGLCFRWFKF